MNVTNKMLLSKFRIPNSPSSVEIEVGLAILGWSRKDLSYHAKADLSSINRMMKMLDSNGMIKVRTRVIETINKALLNKFIEFHE